MKLIFLYGPPAVGKLTVAKELARLTGFSLFHNHLTVDLVASLFPMGTKEYSGLVRKIRLALIGTAAQEKISGMIFTFVYGVETYKGRKDDMFVYDVIRTVSRYRGRVLFVKLTCETRELHRRLKHPARRLFKKVHIIKTLKSIRKNYNLDATIPFGKSFILDTTRRSPQRVA